MVMAWHGTQSFSSFWMGSVVCCEGAAVLCRCRSVGSDSGSGSGSCSCSVASCVVLRRVSITNDWTCLLFAVVANPNVVVIIPYIRVCVCVLTSKRWSVSVLRHCCGLLNWFRTLRTRTIEVLFQWEGQDGYKLGRRRRRSVLSPFVDCWAHRFTSTRVAQHSTACFLSVFYHQC